jgi:hypothetical protein
MGDAHTALMSRVGEELATPASAPAHALCEEIVERHGDPVAAVLFYGSCLRKNTGEGVLDFYVIVDDYRAFYRGRMLAWLNSWMPPNVFYLEAETREGHLRCKYAVMSVADFARANSSRSIRPAIWARFCQPARAVYVRDEPTREAITSACVDAVRTATLRALPLLPDAHGVQDVEPERFWLTLFDETYGSELRTESSDTIQGLYHTDTAHYDELLRHTLADLDAAGQLDAQGGEPRTRVTHRPGRLRSARRSRRLRRPTAKALAFVQLIKTTFTFGDWLPYALWKLERHTGTRPELTERQHRHPLIFAWPVIWRILRDRDLR